MILKQNSTKELMHFFSEVDPYAGVISILSHNRKFEEPLTFCFVKDARLSVEIDYTDPRIQEVIFSFYLEVFDGFQKVNAEIKYETPCLVCPNKNDVERHVLYWNLDYMRTPFIFVGKDYVDIATELEKEYDEIYRDGKLDIFMSSGILVGFRLNGLNASDLELVKERLSINRNPSSR